MTVRGGQTSIGLAMTEIEYSFPPHDAIVGFSVLFRQCYATDERASFAKVKSILWRASGTVGDEHGPQRQDHIRAWARAQAQLRAFDLRTLCSEALDGGRKDPMRAQPHSPEFIISVFNYGEDIHWDRQRETASLWKNDEFLGPHLRMEFFESTCSLAFVYLGFALLCRSALGDQRAT